MLYIHLTIIDSLRQANKLHKEIYLQSDKDFKEIAMSEFNRKYIDGFLGTVRKYMQMRGGLNQKDLADLTEVGVSTMSRFLNQKTREIDPQLIAKIVSKLDIPLHEIIDFVEEDYADRFIRLVKFFKGEEVNSQSPVEDVDRRQGHDRRKGDDRRHADKKDSEFEDAVTGLDNKKKNKKQEGGGIREKLERLSPRQKAFLMEFLDMDVEGRDLIADLGNSISRYTRQKGIQF